MLRYRITINSEFQIYLPWGIYMMDTRIQSLPQAIKKNIEGREYTIDDMGNCGIADKW